MNTYGMITEKVLVVTAVFTMTALTAFCVQAETPPQNNTRYSYSDADSLHKQRRNSPLVSAPQASSVNIAMQRLMQHNPELKFEAKNLSQAEKTLRANYSEWLPKISLSATSGRKKASTDLADNIYNYNDVSVDVKQNVFNGFATQNRWDSANLKFQRDTMRYQRKLNDKTIELIQIYIEYQRLQANYNAVRDGKAVIAELLDNVRKRGSSGYDARVEVHRLESRFLAIENQLFTQYQSLRQVEHAFFELTRSKFAAVLAPLMAYQDYTVDNIPQLALAGLFDIADKHPLRQEAEILSQIRFHDKKEVQAGYYPRVDLVYRHSMSHNTNGNVDVAGNNQDEDIILLQLSWSLFDGMATTNRTAAAIAAYEGAKYALQDVQYRIERKVEDAYARAVITSNSLKSALLSVEAAELTRKRYRALVNAGRRTLIELANVAEEEMRAKVEYNNQQYAALLLSYQLPYEMGIFIYNDFITQ